MRMRSLSALIAVTAVMVAAAWFISVERAPQTDISKTPLYPGLVERINDVARLSVESARTRAVLVKDGDQWRVENRAGYPARFDAVKRTVVSIADLRVLEAKTRRPALYPRLGVEDIDAEDAASRRITLESADGEVLAALIVGHERKGSAAARDTSPALYVRKAGTEQALLVEGEVPATAAPADWMDTAIVDIDSDRIRAFSIAHADGETVSVRRHSRDVKDYELEQVPPGQEVRSLALLTSLGTALEQLRFDDVAAASERPLPPDAATRATYRTFDGLVVQARIAEIDGRHWAVFSARQDPEALAAAEAAPDAGDTASAADPAKPAAEADEPHNAEAIAQEAAAINERVAPWVYALPDFKAAMLTKRTADLVRTPQDDAPAAGPPGELIVPEDGD